MKQSLYTIISSIDVMPGIHLMWINAPDIAMAALPGQFITVRCGDFILRRPFSVHRVSSQDIAILFKVAGKGTLWLSQQQKGDRIDILGPLGKGFGIESGSKNLLLVAGGIGIAPIIFLAQHTLSQYQVTLIHGASTAAQLYPFFSTGKSQSKLPPLPSGVQFTPVTEDGTLGKKGMPTDILPDFVDWADQIYTCGPVDMYRAMAKMSLRAKRSNLKLTNCQVSLEVRMGCGFGVCYGCTINTKKGLKQVCRDGPVFELDDIIWEEIRI